jgi:molybdenum cofactor biosynthesis protein B
MGHEGHDHRHPHSHGPRGHDDATGQDEHGHHGGGGHSAEHHGAAKHGPTEHHGAAKHDPAEHHGSAKHGSASAREHKSHAPVQVATFVITCSDSRAPARDESGQALRQLLGAAGHTEVGYVVIPDDAERLRAAMGDALEKGARAILITGGTGIGRRDITVEVVRALFEKELPGFGELFRALSYRAIGSAAMMSRATAGTWKGAIVFALPGSPNAVRVAMEALVLPELGHAVRELTR